ncbi:granzyme B(G,H) [Ictalurus furcatus]|uniref:granzyme B(G,H) n=1 Tax=Ictalurus furcatus TaxID=66913 RepID=UPI002350D18E|nr:granzyme B(G,H) [Ictalurus furcatus]
MFFSSALLVLSVLSLCGGMKSGIIGGNEVKPHSRPYMASVQINNKHNCGGCLIRNDYVLTAAHCVANIDHSGKDKLEVLLGAHNINRKESQQQRIQVQQFIPHPSYKQHDGPNDIVLLKLLSVAKLNKFVKVIALPEKNENLPDHQECSIAGWGRTAQNSSVSSVLREVKLQLQNNSQCKKLWKNKFDTDSMICTVSDGKKTPCKGDSGSPLICGNIPQGIAAFGKLDDCLSRTHPVVYMKISYFLPWIKKVIP